MSWNISVRNQVVVVTMTSSAVNKMNPAFFDDMNAALDAIERDHPRLPLVLTGQGTTFSAGLDFNDVFPRFATGGAAAVTAWFERFRETLLRLFTLPRRTVAAVNGNAFAGGLILALCCDLRVCADSDARFALNEVLVGIPLPAAFAEIVRHAVGTQIACEAVLESRIYNVAEARERRLVHLVVPAHELASQAIEAARTVPADSYSAYVASKQILQHHALKQIRGDGQTLDDFAMRTAMQPDSQRAQAATLAQLKKKK